MKFALTIVTAFSLVVYVTACAKVGSQDPDIETQAFEENGETSNRYPASLANTEFGVFIRQAVLVSPLVSREDAAIREARAQEASVSGAYTPRLSVGLQPRNGASIDASPYVSLSQKIFDGGASNALRTAARANSDEVILNRSRVATDVVFSAAEAWINLIADRAVRRLAENYLHRQAQIVTQIDHRVSAGLGANTEFFLAQSRLANEEAEISEHISKALQSEATFEEIFVQPVPLVLGSVPHAPYLTDINHLENPPSLRFARAAIQTAEVELEAARKRRFPNFAITISSTFEGQPTAGLAVEHALTGNNSDRSRVDITQAQLDARRATYEASRRELQRRFGTVQAEIISAVDVMNAAQSAALANEANLASLRTQVSVGARDLIDLMDAERENYTAQKRVIRAEQNLQRLEYLRLAITGDIVDIFGIQFGAN